MPPRKRSAAGSSSEPKREKSAQDTGVPSGTGSGRGSEAPSAAVTPAATATATAPAPTSSMGSATSGMVIVFAHGAGAGSSHEWMQQWKRRLESLGADVHLFDYPYMQRGKKAPDHQTVLIESHVQAIEEAAARFPGKIIVLAGKSMGSRMGLHASQDRRVADAQLPVRACICFGYPLVGQSGAVRSEVLLSQRLPVLFVQGTRDALCPLDELEAFRKRITCPTSVHVVQTGDHSLQVLKKAPVSQAESDAAVLRAVRSFLKEHQILS